MLLINLLRIAGIALLGLFVMNFFVPGRFKWREDMAQLSLINRRIFQVHAIFIAMILLMMGLLLVALPAALLEPRPLARAVLAGLAVFWGARLYMQWFLYDRERWSAKPFETPMNGTLTALGISLTATFSAR